MIFAWKKKLQKESCVRLFSDSDKQPPTPFSTSSPLSLLGENHVKIYIGELFIVPFFTSPNSYEEWAQAHVPPFGHGGFYGSFLISLIAMQNLWSGCRKPMPLIFNPNPQYMLQYTERQSINASFPPRQHM